MGVCVRVFMCQTRRDDAFCNHAKWQTRIFRMQSFCRTRRTNVYGWYGCCCCCFCLLLLLDRHVCDVERVVFVYFSVYSILILQSAHSHLCEDVVFDSFRSVHRLRCARFVRAYISIYTIRVQRLKITMAKTKTEFLSCVNTQISNWCMAKMELPHTHNQPTNPPTPTCNCNR